VSGPTELMHAVSKAHQFLVFTTAPNLAFGLPQDDSYFQGRNDSMRGKHDRLSEALDKIPRFESAPGFDVDFCKHITSEAG
jgi:N-succinyldiaminopimelate aminotransferase